MTYAAPAAPVVAATEKSPARLIVKLPADAKLTIDGEATKSTTSERVFLTPPLTPGKSYSYTLQATVVVEGKNEVITKEVQVFAGQETRETLSVQQTVAAVGK
jgi:uncharacterized protein (TIGR03000 family)